MLARLGGATSLCPCSGAEAGFSQSLNHALSPASQNSTNIAPTPGGAAHRLCTISCVSGRTGNTAVKGKVVMFFPLQVSPRIHQRGAPSGSGAGARLSCPGKSSASSTCATPSVGGRTLGCSKAAAPALRMLRSLKLRASLCQHLYSLLQRHRQ